MSTLPSVLIKNIVVAAEPAAAPVRHCGASLWVLPMFTDGSGVYVKGSGSPQLRFHRCRPGATLP